MVIQVYTECNLCSVSPPSCSKHPPSPWTPQQFPSYGEGFLQWSHSYSTWV